MFCTQCGARNPDEARFCRTCGANFSQPRPTTPTPATPTAQPYRPPSSPAPAQPLDQAPHHPPYPGYQGFPVAPTHMRPQVAAMKSSASTQATLAMILSIASFVTCCLPLGVVGLVLGKLELTAIEEGRSAAAGKKFAKVGFYLGIVSTALLAVGYLIGFLFS